MGVYSAGVELVPRGVITSAEWEVAMLALNRNTRSTYVEGGVEEACKHMGSTSIPVRDSSGR